MDVADDGAVVTIKLADVSGVDVWSLSFSGSDDQVAVPALTVDSVAKTATFTKPAGPWALIVTSKVNNGVDVNGQKQDSYTTTFGIYVKTATKSLRLVASNERAEGSTAFGWSKTVNAAIRGVESASGGGSSIAVHAGLTTDYTVTETSGIVLLSFKSFAAPHTLTLPAAPTAGLIVAARSEDDTITDANTLTWGAGGTVHLERANVSATTYVQNRSTYGINGSAEFYFDGTLYRARS